MIERKEKGSAVLHFEKNIMKCWTKQQKQRIVWAMSWSMEKSIVVTVRSEKVSLTSQAINYRRPLLFLFLLWCSTVLSVHLTDRGCAFSLDLCVKVLIKQNLVHQVWLHRAGLCRGLRCPIVVSWNEERETSTTTTKYTHQYNIRIDSGIAGLPCLNIVLHSTHTYFQRFNIVGKNCMSVLDISQYKTRRDNKAQNHFGDTG